MNHTMLLTPAQRAACEKLIAQHPKLHDILEALCLVRARPYFVGGAVRDLMLELPVKDIDIEVHGITLEQLDGVLRKFGHVNHVGKSFGVLLLEGLPIDWALPRRDSSGRKPEVQIDPTMTIEEALARRDLTMNAMAISYPQYLLIDPFGGMNDMHAKRLRAPNAKFFVEDPLRLFRVMQFVSRFEMEPDDELNNICTTMSLEGISRERIEQECEKMLLRSRAPSRGLRWLNRIGRLQDLFPELAATRGVVQPLQWHPEGDVLEHSFQALDAAAMIIRNNVLDSRDALTLLYTALFHDLGKQDSTVVHDDGKVTSHGHEITGVPLVRACMKRITSNTTLIDTISVLVRHHMAPGIFIKQGAHDAAYKRLASKLAPHTTMHMLSLLAFADRAGRNGEDNVPLAVADEVIIQFAQRAQDVAVLHEAEKPILQGRDLLDVEKPGPRLGELVRRAYEIQINEGVHDKDTLRARVLKNEKE